jgi:hypothetical protein
MLCRIKLRPICGDGPKEFFPELCPVRVETMGTLSLGQTVPLRGPAPNMRVCVGVDRAQVIHGIVETILA